MTPDIDIITDAFVEMGPELFRRKIDQFSLAQQGIDVYKNVKAPIALPMIEGIGSIRPYHEADHTTGNGAKFTDRKLEVNQSKMDFDIDPERFRNKYLANKEKVPYYEYIINAAADKYMNELISTARIGVYDSAGTTALDVADGWGTILNTLVTDTDVTDIATGAVTAANAVTKAEIIADAAPAWMLENGFSILCSYQTLRYYRTHYRATFGFNFDKNESGRYKLDGYEKVYLEPRIWVPGSTLLGVPDDYLALGTDGERMEVHATKRRNIIEVRLMLPIGFQVGPQLDKILINDQPFA